MYVYLQFLITTTQKMKNQQMIIDYLKTVLDKDKDLANQERELGRILVQIWQNKHFIEVEDLEKLSYFIYKQK